MRAGRPRSRVGRPDGEVGGIQRATSLKAGLSPLGNSRLPASRAPAPRDGADHPRVKQVLFQIRHEDRGTSFNDNWRQNASALLSRWCDPVMGGSPPGSAGVPPASLFLPTLRPRRGGCRWSRRGPGHSHADCTSSVPPTRNQHLTSDVGAIWGRIPKSSVPSMKMGLRFG